MTARTDAEATLRAIGRGPKHGFDIAGGALALAALESPSADLAPYRAHLDELAAALADSGAAGPSGSAGRRAAALAGTVFGRHGYRGDDLTYDDLQNANLMRVIDRRKGLPVALGILYLHAARARGWTAYGLNFPGHFLIAVEAAGERAILDPFHEGRSRTPPELRELLKAVAGQDAELDAGMYAPVTDRAVLLRLQSNVKLRLLQMQQFERAATVVDSMLLFAPAQPRLWHEAGMLHARLGNLLAATRALETCLAQEPDARSRQEAASLLQDLRRRMN